jgi:hypothetical protein
MTMLGRWKLIGLILSVGWMVGVWFALHALYPETDLDIFHWIFIVGPVPVAWLIGYIWTNLYVLLMNGLSKEP